METEDVGKPTASNSLTAEQILFGPPIEPLLRIQTYSDKEFEFLIQEWAYYYLKQKSGLYTRVVRLGGSGDLGRDVVGYLQEGAAAEFEVYQCKHYAGPISPSDIWSEIGKLIYRVSTGELKRPRRFYLVAPRDVGPKLEDLLNNPADLREGLRTNWEKHCAGAVRASGRVELDRTIQGHIDAFDFSVIRHKPILEVIAELRQTPAYAPRFGGGLQPPPTAPAPEPLLSATETRYIDQLLRAYSEDSGEDAMSFEAARDGSSYSKHLYRSRVRYYCAESLERFARDALAGGPGFADVKDDVLDTVIETAESSSFASGLERCDAVQDQSLKTQVGSNPIGPHLRTRELKGICHQLVNDSRLSWVTDDSE